MRDRKDKIIGLHDEGVLWVKGPSVVPGYFRDEVNTKDRFHDGWFNTGDVVRIDEDGYIKIVDRATDIIIVSGFNVYPQDVEAVALAVKAVLDDCADAKAVAKLKSKDLQSAAADADRTRPVTLDIALFGRMVTSDAFRDVEASMQVAHAISTNRVSVESDYFTAMDDLLDGGSLEEAGAGMIGDVDYNSSCYYLYASLDTDALKDALKDAENADEIVALALPALLRAMAFTNPGGKQNSFAGHVLPGCFLVECKEKKIPVSLVNAFVSPVSGGDILKESIQRLADETDMLAADFGLPVKERVWFCVDKYGIAPKTATRVCASFPELVEAVVAQLN